MIKFEDVSHISTEEYFNGNQFSVDVFNKKYSLNNSETYVHSLKRVCDYIASAEKTEEDRKYWSERWFDEIYNDWWHPAGSIMQGANSKRGISLSNCTTLTLGAQEDTEWDNLESIIKNTTYTVAKTAAYRQGLGIDFSKIRPAEMNVLNSSEKSQGAIHWMKLIDSMGNYIGQNGRIPAMLFSLSIDHPDIEEFIKVKSDYTKIQNANISVQTNNAFYKAVEDDSEWEMIFTIPEVKKGQKIYVDVHSTDLDTQKDDKGYFYIAKRDRKEEKIVKKKNARELLELLAKNMLANSEPGIQQIDMARYWSNSDYVYDPNDEYNSKIISTNACSEQYLSRESLCVLASINAGRFSIDFNEYDKELNKIAYSVNRFLDNVNTKEVEDKTYATPHQRLAIEKLRRTGAGITNMAAWLFKQNLEYASQGGNEALSKFSEVYNYYLYKSSIELGKEKGSFGLFVKEKYEQSPFIQNMMKQGLVFDTMRNCNCSSIAPTGCIDENTRIVTSKGLIKIKDILEVKPDIKQFSYNIPEIYTSDECNNNNQITAFYNNGIVDGYVIEFEDGRRIKVSETHRIRIIKDGKYDWEYAPNLKNNDIAVLYLNNDLENKEMINLNVKKGSMHHSAMNVNYPLILNNKLAEMIGLFTGDGNLHFRRRDSKPDSIRYTVYSEDYDVVERITNYFKELFNVNVSVKKEERENTFTVCINSVNVCNFWVDNGFNKKDKITIPGYDYIYKVPELIFRSPKHIIRSYLKGLFEADGTVGKTNINLSSKHENIVLEVQELLTYLGIKSVILKHFKGKYKWYTLELRYSKDKAKFINDIGFISNRKRKKCEVINNKIDKNNIYMLVKDINLKAISEKYGSKSSIYGYFFSLKSKYKSEEGLFVNKNNFKKLYEDGLVNKLPFDLDNYFNLKIKNITREKFQTYDVEVNNEKHTYITSNGVINHNTLSMMFRDFVMSYGVEPAFGMYFWKRTRITGQYEYYFCVPNVVREYFKQNGYEIPIDADCIKDTWDGKYGKPIVEFIEDVVSKLGVKFKQATEVNAFDKLDLMSGLMKSVDSSISVTYLLSEKASWEDVYNLIIEANKKGVKSISAFPDKKMYGIVSYLPFKELAFKLKKENVEIHAANFSEDELKELSLLNKSKPKPEVFKRNKKLEADVYTVKVGGKKYLMAVGIQDGSPYEIFGGAIPEFINYSIPKKGEMIKVKKGHYKLDLGNHIIEDFGSLFTGQEQIMFRMLSTSLRHGIPIKFLVEQLSKSAEDVIDLASATSRVLKKYIANGERAGGKCPACGKQELIYIDGCVFCTCGWSKGCG